MLFLLTRSFYFSIHTDLQPQTNIRLLLEVVNISKSLQKIKPASPHTLKFPLDNIFLRLKHSLEVKKCKNRIKVCA